MFNLCKMFCIFVILNFPKTCSDEDPVKSSGSYRSRIRPNHLDPTGAGSGQIIWILPDPDPQPGCQRIAWQSLFFINIPKMKRGGGRYA